MWQPIETAPKNGTCVIIIGMQDEIPFVRLATYRSKEMWDQYSRTVENPGDFEDWGGWWAPDATGPDANIDRLAPTHWMEFNYPAEYLNYDYQP